MRDNRKKSLLRFRALSIRALPGFSPLNQFVKVGFAPPLNNAVSPNMRATIALIFFVTVSCASGASKAEQDRAQNGFIKSGWMVSVGHLGAEAYTSLGYAIANDTLAAKVRSLKRDVPDDISCHIVPQIEGYHIVILSRRRLSQEDEKKIKGFVDESLQIGSEKAHELRKG